MVDAPLWIEALQRHGVTHFAGVPCSLLEPLCSALQATVPALHHVIAANEGGAVAWAIGQAIATGNVPCVYLQNSGLGHAVNPLASIAHESVYGVGLLLVIGWRGEPGLQDEPQHTTHGAATPLILESLGIRTQIMARSLDDSLIQTRDTLQYIVRCSRPAALLVSRLTFGGAVDPPVTLVGPLLKSEALRTVVAAAPADAIIIATTGRISRELSAIRSTLSQADVRDFLNVGGMGHSVMIALGMAESQPGRPVWCLDGDGAILMHLGAMAIVGSRKPSNLVHVVINDGAHDSVGGQPTAARDIDLSAVASACGYSPVAVARDLGELQQALHCGRAERRAPLFIEVQVRRDATELPSRPSGSFSARLGRLRQCLVTTRP